MDFIVGCEGRWRRNKVAQPEDGGAGFNTKTHHQVDGSNGNGEMREEGGGGALFVANTNRRHRSSSFTCTCKSRIFAQQELNSCWVMFLVDRWAYTCRISPSTRLFNQTCRVFLLFIPFLRLQVRIGGFSPHARSLTPAWCLF